jgi:hypothetical protein
MRPQFRFLVLAASTVLVACLPTTADAATTPFASKSAAQILALTAAAMSKAGSVRLVNKTELDGTAAFTLTTDSSPNQGTQVQDFSGGVETIRLIGRTLFLNANAAAYSLDYNVSNSTLANEWVRVPSSNANYSNIAAAILMPSLVSYTVGMKSLKDLGVKRFHGLETVAIKGLPLNLTPGTSETQTVYVSMTAPYLPVGLSTEFLEGVNGAGTSVFSHWGEDVAVTSPTTSVTATSDDFP